jgi:hypothetical protein
MEFIPEEAAVNKQRYKEILKRLCNSIRHKRPELWIRKNWMLLHDNAPAHRSVLVQEELAKQRVTILPHPPYSSDFAPWDFFFFPRFKEKLCGHQFQPAKEIVTATGELVQDRPANIFQQFPAAIPMLADLHSGQQWLFWGRMWMCVSVCEYLVTWRKNHSPRNYWL